MLDILIAIIVLAIVAYAVYVLINWLPLPDPIKTVVLLLFAAIVLLALAGLFGIGPGTGLKLSGVPYDPGLPA